MNKSNNLVITGVSTGIGYELARQFLDRGYRVFGSVRNKEDADRLEHELGDDFAPLIFDVTDYLAIERAVEVVENQVGAVGIGGLINNAGVAVGGPSLHVDIKDFEYQFKVNVFGLFKCMQAFAPLLGARQEHLSKPGKILNISSVSGKLAFPFVGPYAASKHAVEAISQSLRRELLLYGIDIIVIAPGPVKTPIWNKGLQLEPYYDTPYGKILKRFENGPVKKSYERAFEAEYLARRILKVFEKKRPKTRYTMAPGALLNHYIPRWLPDRSLDRLVKKLMRVK